MKTFTVQYSTLSANSRDLAISDWPERTKMVKTNSSQEAITKFEKNRDGTWMILDCWEVENK